MDFTIIIYIIFGILPALTWLFYYLRKDVHPEPKAMILKVFLWGSVITLPVFFVQLGLAYILGKFYFTPPITALIYYFLVIAFSEEIFKALVIKLKVLGSPHVDEPLDIMLYMVISALGFAALENILYLFSPTGQLSFNEIINRALIIAFIRFIGATFLHTLCSAVIGYAIAMSTCFQKNKILKIILGITLAVFLHGLYNFSIMILTGYARLLVPVTIILTLAILVYMGFERLKKLKGICKVN